MYVCITAARNDDIGGVLHRAQERDTAPGFSDNGRLERTDDGQSDAEHVLLDHAFAHRPFQPRATKRGLEATADQISG